MLLTTTNTVEGKNIVQYYGIVTGEVIIGANAVIAVDIDYETINRMMMVAVSGTAVRVE